MKEENSYDNPSGDEKNPNNTGVIIKEDDDNLTNKTEVNPTVITLNKALYYKGTKFKRELIRFILPFSLLIFFLEDKITNLTKNSLFEAKVLSKEGPKLLQNLFK